MEKSPRQNVGKKKPQRDLRGGERLGRSGGCL